VIILLVISKSYTEGLDAGRAGWLARQGARASAGTTTDFPLPGARQTRREDRWVATNGDAKRPPVTMVSDSHGWGSSNINWPLPF
jgi:hypothetical protein